MQIPISRRGGTAVKTVEQATPSISIGETGLITTIATQTGGYVEEGTKSSTLQLTTQEGKIIIPSKSEQTAVAKGVYTIGNIAVGAIPDEYTSLNFKVVGGTTQPSSPKNNTIWVNTSTNIPSWSISTSAPSSPTTGTVWIPMSTSSNFKFNSLQENIIEIRFVTAQQYVNSKWTDITTNIYQNGTWIRVVKDFYFYDYGTRNVGWSSSYVGANSANIVSGSQYIGFECHWGSIGSSWTTTTAVDLTGYKTLNLQLIRNSSTMNQLWIGFVKDAGSTSPAAYIDLRSVNTNGAIADRTLDVSQLNGTYYLKMYSYIVNGNEGTLYLYKAFLT